MESSKGIYTISIYSFPYRTMNIISNDFLTSSQPNKFCRYINLGDTIAVLGSIDFVLGSVDPLLWLFPTCYS
jgi:NADH:ubiquinone oxidoreductase subunit D